MRRSLLAQLRALDQGEGDPPALSGITDGPAPTTPTPPDRTVRRSLYRPLHRSSDRFAKGREGKGREGKGTSRGTSRRQSRTTSSVNRHSGDARTARHVLTIGSSADA